MGRNSSGNRGGSDTNTDILGNKRTAEEATKDLPKGKGKGLSGELIDINLATTNNDMFADIVFTYKQLKNQVGEDIDTDLYLIKTNENFLGVTIPDMTNKRSVIALNEKYFGKNSKAEDLQQALNMNKASGFLQSNALNSTLVHEFGHAVMNQVAYKHGANAFIDLGKTMNTERVLWGNPVKGEGWTSSLKRLNSYAYSSLHEYTAEMFAKQYNTADRLNSPSKFSMKAVNILDDYLKNGKKTKKY